MLLLQQIYVGSQNAHIGTVADKICKHLLSDAHSLMQEVVALAEVFLELPLQN